MYSYSNESCSRDHKDCPAIRANQDVQDRKASKECRDRQVHRDSQASRVRTDQQDQQDILGHKVNAESARNTAL